MWYRDIDVMHAWSDFEIAKITSKHIFNHSKSIIVYFTLLNVIFMQLTLND